MDNQFKGKGALDAFLNLFSLITLTWTSIAIGIILFQIIDKFLSAGTVFALSRYSQQGLKFGVASALIVTPIFLFIVTTLHKNYKKGSLNPQSGVYRWLTYLILLVTALNIIGRLIQLVFKLLDGDYTLASILKISVVLAIAGGIFGYYWYDLKRNNYSKRSQTSQIFFGIIVIVTVVSIIASFFIIDSPKVTNMKKFDQQRVNDLYNLDNMINSYYRETRKIPEDLSDSRFSQVTDPKTDEPYSYTVVSEEEFEICATFELAVVDDDDEDYKRYGGKDWDFHQAGHQCFTSFVFDSDKPLPIPRESFY
ncbi:MAG: hypothetical protein CMI53_05650 [Parcubacteria group bacterium]|nr:hypothetical protein [Parcubacteria group bacterium]|tara:strand:- start:6502 stop:7428 length:927 start_codon:yes stop_codon:yes gene_type:complete